MPDRDAARGQQARGAPLAGEGLELRQAPDGAASDPAGGDSGFVWPVRVYYEDTDAAGLVYYANYLKFLERARSERLRAAGLDQRALKEQDGVVFVVRRLSVDYRKPARFDDRLVVGADVVEMGRCRVRFRQDIRRDGELLVAAEVEVACIDGAVFRPAPIPPAVRRGLFS